MQRLSMLSSLLIASLTCLALPHAANAQGIGQTACSTASLSGRYIFKYFGYLGTGAPYQPYGTVGDFTVDGNGNGNATKTTIVNGSSAQITTDPFTYSVNSDCVATLSTGQNLQITIYFASPSLLSPIVSVGHAIILLNGSTIVGEVRRQP